MKLQELISKLEKHHKKKLDLSLGRTFNLLKKLGNPQDKLKNVVIQGGLNPNILLKSDEDITKAATKYIQTFKDIPYVFNLGHGLLPETDPDKVKKLIKLYRDS